MKQLILKFEGGDEEILVNINGSALKIQSIKGFGPGITAEDFEDIPLSVLGDIFREEGLMPFNGKLEE